MTAPNPQYGIAVKGDRLAPVTQTLDGVDLNELWNEFAELLLIWNAERTALTDLLVFDTTASAEAVAQNQEVASFEESSDLGIPKAAGVPGNGLLVGYKFRDYDLAGRFSWRALRDWDSRQVRSIMDNILSADNKLVTGMIFRQLFSNARSKNEFGAPVWDFYDGQAPGPPSYLTRTFPDTETHFITTQSSQIDSDTVFDAIRLITRKGYGLHPNSKMLLLTNPDEGELIMQWRQGLESRPKEGTETEGPISEYSFIPAIDQPPWITSDGMLVGTQAPGDVWGIKVWGTWGPVSLIQSDYVPPGYSALITTYGPNSPYNPIGFRQHFNSDYHGLRHLPGEGPFPLVSSFHQRSFGVGVRHRGACVAIQVATSSTYTAPTDAQIPV